MLLYVFAPHSPHTTLFRVHIATVKQLVTYMTTETTKHNFAFNKIFAPLHLHSQATPISQLFRRYDAATHNFLAFSDVAAAAVVIKKYHSNHTLSFAWSAASLSLSFPLAASVCIRARTGHSPPKLTPSTLVFPYSSLCIDRSGERTDILNKIKENFHPPHSRYFNNSKQTVFHHIRLSRVDHATRVCRVCERRMEAAE